MCYYNGVKVLKTEFIRLKDIEKAVAAYDFLTQPLQPGFEYGNHPVLVKSADNDFEITRMEWGFIPGYIRTREDVMKMRFGYKKPDGSFQPPITTLNATAEELLKPGKIYRNAALKNRCLVLSTGFFEWRHVYPLNKRTGLPVKTPLKYPYHISLKDREYFFMAAIYTPWKDVSTGELVNTYAIITTSANSLMEQVHNSKKRMPCILPDDLAWKWLMDELSEEEVQELALYRFPSSEMQACTIAKDFREATEPSASFVYPELENIFES